MSSSHVISLLSSDEDADEDMESPAKRQKAGAAAGASAAAEQEEQSASLAYSEDEGGEAVRTRLFASHIALESYTALPHECSKLLPQARRAAPHVIGLPLTFTHSLTHSHPTLSLSPSLSFMVYPARPHSPPHKGFGSYGDFEDDGFEEDEGDEEGGGYDASGPANTQEDERVLYVVLHSNIRSNALPHTDALHTHTHTHTHTCLHVHT